MHMPWNFGCGALLLMVGIQLMVDTIRMMQELWSWNFKGAAELFNISMAVLRYLLGLQ